MQVKKIFEASCEGEVTTIDDHVKSSDLFKHSEGPRKFEYKLNDKLAKSKLVKAAKRTSAFIVEENSTSSNLVFSTGAWHNIVLPTVKYWNEVKDDKTCKIGDYLVSIGGIKSGVEKGGKQVDTQVVFYAD